MEKWLFLVQWCTKFSRLNGKSCALRSLRSLRNETSFKNNIFFLSYQGTDDDGFAKPKLTSSVLGLQELARKRRQEKEEAEDRKKKMRKKRHDSSSSSSNSDDDSDGGDERSQKQDKHYRFE